jgi:hypothetical protein
LKTLQPQSVLDQVVSLTKVQDTEEGLELFKALMDAINATWNHREDLVAMIARKHAPRPLDIWTCCRKPNVKNMVRQPAWHLPATCGCNNRTLRNVALCILMNNFLSVGQYYLPYCCNIPSVLHKIRAILTLVRDLSIDRRINYVV